MGGFWSQGQAAQVKRAYRWLCFINNIDEWLIKSVTKPNFSMSEISHKFINHTFWYPGRVEWNAIDVTLVDPVNPDAHLTVLHLIERSGYQIPDRIHTQWKTISKRDAVNALNSVEIRQIDSNGDPLESWYLKNPFIKGATFGNLSYDSDDIMTITLSIRYDWAYFRSHQFGGLPGTAIGTSRTSPSDGSGVPTSG